MKKRWSVLIALLLAPSSVMAEVIFHVDTGVLLIEIAAGILVLASFVVLPLKKHLNETGKKIVFWSLVIPTLIATIYFGVAIVNENIVSVTQGPVHWHADYQVIVCGERLDLVNPSFPRNKIGSPLFHEHDDDRIHVEGTVMELEDVDLGSYFNIIGGELSDGVLQYPSTNGMVEVRDGDTCNGQPSQLSVYVNGEKVEDYWDHKMYPNAYVPPGDCIIVEFGPQSGETTERICSSWSAKGWSYDDYERAQEEIGGHAWQ